MGSIGDRRGILYPTRLPSFHRAAPPSGLEELVRWFWVPRWNLGPGRTSRQELLPFPASNLVVEPGGVSCAGPTTSASFRDLRGSGWAVGALLRPAAIGALRIDPQGMRDTDVAFDAAELHRAVALAMDGQHEAQGQELAVAAFAAWALEHLAQPDESGLLANAMEDLVASDRTLVRVDQLARELGMSVRALQRLTRTHVGLAPLAIIRRYRLQEAAQRLRDDPSTTIAQVAAELEYADHAHLSSDFRRVLGFSPSTYRNDPDHGPR